MHDLLKYICREVEDDPIGTRCCYKLDIHKFYDSVDQDLLMESVRRVFNKLTGKQMKSFKDLNVSYKPDDGKKRVSGTVVNIRELVNLPIVVKDYELGIKTEQGDNRCLVSIEQVNEMPDGFPVETTIRAETFGKGKTKYVFN